MKYYDEATQTYKNIAVKALDSMPIGTIMQYAGETIPNGWLLCNGDAVATTEYPDLYNAIGTRYGGTSDNFRLPDFRGRVAVGVNLSDEDFDTLGNFGGSKELQEHTHNLRYSNGGAVGVGGYTTTSSSYVYDTSAGSIESAGTGDSGNLQPYLVVNYIIKAFSVVPTMRGITNNYSTSTKDGYSCDYVNDLHTYSTTEQRVGTWIDGKPIYRKVINLGNITTSSPDEFDTGITNATGFVRLWGSTKLENSFNMAIPSYNDAYQGINFRIHLSSDLSKIITSRTSNSFYNTNVIIEYTKSG